jgi:peptidyl-dipeptidase Dcp
MKRLFAILAFAAMLMTSCTKTNPFLAEWDTPYGIPPFDQIKEAHYIPAIEEGIKQHNAEIEAIINNPEAPTFDNVIGAYDLSGGLLAKVSGVLFNLAETDITPTLEKIVDDATTMLSQHENEIIFNKALFAKVEAVNNAKEGLGLTREQEMVLDKVYRSFADNGIALDEGPDADGRIGDP